MCHKWSFYFLRSLVSDQKRTQSTGDDVQRGGSPHVLRYEAEPRNEFTVPDYNGFRGALNQKSIPLKTTESRRGPQRPYDSVVLCASSVVLCDCEGLFTGLP